MTHQKPHVDQASSRNAHASQPQKSPLPNPAPRNARAPQSQKSSLLHRASPIPSLPEPTSHDERHNEHAQRAPHQSHLAQDHLDVLIALRQDCRVKHTDLARQMGWPVSTTHERMRRYAKRSVTRHTCLLDFRALGFLYRTIWIVKPQHRDEWIAHASTIQQLNTICRTHAGDFLVESICRDSEEENVVRERLGIGALIVSSHTVIDDIKTEAAFASAEYLPVFGVQSAQHPAE